MPLDQQSQALISKLFNVANLWDPAYFLTNTLVLNMVFKVSEISVSLLILFFTLETARQLYMSATEENYIVNIYKPLIKVAIFGSLVVSGLGYVFCFNTFLVNPVVGLVNSINEAADISGLISANSFASMSDAVNKNVLNGGSMFSALSNLSVLTMITSLTYHVAMFGLYIISFIQQIYMAILFIVGPIVIPTFIFEPWGDIFMGWVRKTLSVGCWAIFGTLMLKLIFICGLFQTLSKTVENTNDINTLILSLGVAACCFFVPSISDQIVGAGLNAGLSIQSVAQTTGTIAAGAATGGAGAAAMAAGSSAAGQASS
jgi:hypothetical protein